MICKNCGVDIGSQTTCPHCGTNQPETLQQTEAPVSTNPLLGKEYAFSGNDLVLRGRWGIKFHISVGKDRLNIETVPAKKNKIPVVMLDDILSIQESFHMRKMNIFLAVMGVLSVFVGEFWGLVVTALILIFFRERKMKIHLRNGNVLTIYSEDKDSIPMFIEDMRKITKIQ